MRLQELSVGSIIGETLPTRVHIWGRGDTSHARLQLGPIKSHVHGTWAWLALELLSTLGPMTRIFCPGSGVRFFRAGQITSKSIVGWGGMRRGSIFASYNTAIRGCSPS